MQSTVLAQTINQSQSYTYQFRSYERILLCTMSYTMHNSSDNHSDNHHSSDIKFALTHFLYFWSLHSQITFPGI